MEQSIFTKIINKEVPAHFIYEDEVCVVLLDAFPAVKGQTLVIPKEQVDYAFDLPDETYQHIMAVAKKIARASDTAFDTTRTCMAIEGFQVPHVHLKIYPLTTTGISLGDIMEKTKPLDEAEAPAIAAALQAVL